MKIKENVCRAGIFRWISTGALTVTSMLLFVVGCARNPERVIDKALMDSSIQSALYFDLGEAAQISAAIIIPSNAPQPELRAIMVPFATRATDDASELLSAWGSRNGTTLITYIAGPSMPSVSAIRITPIFESAEENDFANKDLHGSLYYMESGLKRRFVYRWPSADDIKFSELKTLARLPRISIDSVFVKLPNGAEIFEQSRGALSPSSEKETPTGRFRIYPQKISDSPVIPPIDISYQVPPTKLQEQIFEYALKLFAAILVPVVGLAILSSDKVKAKRTRMIVLWVGMIAEAFILIGMLVWAFHVQSVSGLGAIFEVTLAVVAAVFTVLLARIKGEV